MLGALKDFFVSLAPPDAHPNHWYVSPEDHAVQYLTANMIYWGILLFTMRLGRSRKGVKPILKERMLFFEHVMGVILITCLIIQTTYNLIMRPFRGIVIMLYPCHIITLCELYLIYGKNAQRLHHVFNVTIFYTFLTSLALMFPDTSSLHLPFHHTVFWTQHILIYVLPFYYTLTKRFALDQSDTYYWLLGISTTGIFIWNVELLASMATSINVNYTLWPPPISPVSGPHYRPLLSIIIGTFFTINGFLTPRVLQSIFNIFPRASPKQVNLSSKKNQNSQKQKAG